MEKEYRLYISTYIRHCIHTLLMLRTVGSENKTHVNNARRYSLVNKRRTKIEGSKRTTDTFQEK
mgnify:CR=1 FL=1